jgi:hypothetical protein
VPQQAPATFIPDCKIALRLLARWYIFKQKIQILGIFEWFYNGRSRFIL